MLRVTYFLLLFSTNFLSAELFQTVHPDEPGVYHVTVFENGTREFVKAEEPRRLAASTPERDWDFRRVSGCVAIGTVSDQGECGGCWAFSSADVAGASLCLNTNKEKNKVLSAQYMIDCHAIRKIGSYTYEQGGCDGGYPVVAFADIQENGLPTRECIPWVGYERSTCPTKCTNGGSLNKSDYRGNFKYVDAYKASLQTLRDLVTTSGPCIAEMKVYDDFSGYKSTDGKFPIYSHPVNSNDYEGHAVTVYGFGSEDDIPYWLIKNSWGSSWGMGGFFKIKMGSNDCGIENNFYSLYDNRDKGDYSEDLVPRLKDAPTPGTGWNNDSECVGKNSGNCASTGGCQWFGTFCDTANPTCEEFDSAYCDIASQWGLDCIPGSYYTCMDRDRGKSQCAKVSVSTCQKTSGCRLYTNGDTQTCDLLGAKCAWFGDSSSCTSESASLELKCYWNSSATPSECISYSTVCRPLSWGQCILPVGDASLCHWYAPSDGSPEFCDVNGYRCSWFSAESCESDSPKFDGMDCKNIDGVCSHGWRAAVPAAWTLFAVVLLALFL